MKSKPETQLASTVKQTLRHYSEALFLALIVALILRFFVVTTYRVTTHQMSPTLIQGDFVVASKVALGLPLPFLKGKKWRPVWPERGEIVVFDCPNIEGKSCVKRLVGLPGDRVEIRAGKLIINMKPVTWPLSGQTANYGPVIVPPKEFFVVSDQLATVNDSRSWGTLSEQELTGIVVSIWASVDWSNPWAGGQLPSMRWGRIFQSVD